MTITPGMRGREDGQSSSSALAAFLIEHCLQLPDSRVILGANIDLFVVGPPVDSDPNDLGLLRGQYSIADFYLRLNHRSSSCSSAAWRQGRWTAALHCKPDFGKLSESPGVYSNASSARRATA